VSSQTWHDIQIGEREKCRGEKCQPFGEDLLVWRRSRRRGRRIFRPIFPSATQISPLQSPSKWPGGACAKLRRRLAGHEGQSRREATARKDSLEVARAELLGGVSEPADELGVERPEELPHLGPVVRVVREHGGPRRRPGCHPSFSPLRLPPRSHGRGR